MGYTVIGATTGAQGLVPYDFVIYKAGSTYKIYNTATGTVTYSSATYLDAILTSCIAGTTYGASFRMKSGVYTCNAAIDAGVKTIILDGEGAGGATGPYNTPITEIKYKGGFGADYLLKIGTPSNYSYGSQVRNILFEGLQQTTPLGGILFTDVQHALVDGCYFNDFYNTTDGCGIDLAGNIGYGCYYGIFSRNEFRRCTNGIRLGYLANACTIIGGRYTGSASRVTYGIHAVTGSTLGILGPADMEDHAYTNSCGLYLGGGTAGKFFGCRFEGNYNDIVIDSGGGTGDHTFVANSHASTAGTRVTDNGAIKSHFFGGQNPRKNGGVATSVADGGTITHGLDTTPTWAIVTPITSGEFVSVTALGATTITVAIKKHDNSAGTTQNLYWIAGVNF